MSPPCLLTTIDRSIFTCEFFALSCFLRYDHLTKNGIGQNFTYSTEINTQLTLTLIIPQRRYFTCSFSSLKVIAEKVFMVETSLLYGTCRSLDGVNNLLQITFFFAFVDLIGQSEGILNLIEFLTE